MLLGEERFCPICFGHVMLTHTSVSEFDQGLTLHCLAEDEMSSKYYFYIPT